MKDYTFANFVAQKDESHQPWDDEIEFDYEGNAIAVGPNGKRGPLRKPLEKAKRYPNGSLSKDIAATLTEPLPRKPYKPKPRPINPDLVAMAKKRV